LKQTTLFFLISFLLLACGMNGKPNTNLGNADAEIYVYLPTKAPLDTLLAAVRRSKTIINFPSFEKMAREKKLNEVYRPGKYRI
jgi:hypothetical protein